MEDTLMDYIRFSVDGQRLDYDRKYYSSTDTIDTLYCNFKFETDDLGHILGGWDLPYLWAQFHDEEGNVYIKAVTDNTCSIPFNCLKQLKFKMTLFATDTEDYMTCKKRYTTNEIAFKFKGRANINYDGGGSPDDPVPTQWQIILDRVDECESNIEELSQNVSAMGDRVDGLSQTVATMGDKVDGIDSRVTTNTNDIATINALTESIKGTGAGFHSSIYRGKYLGDKYTDEQKQAIINGTFDDLFIGDYWIINGITWRIADFDYYYNVYYLDDDEAHHVIIVPDTILYEAQMNPTDTTQGCYTGSEMYTKNLDEARAAFDDAFGSMFIATHKGYYSNSTDDNGIPNMSVPRDMRVELMSEEQVYGHAVWGVCNQNGFDVGTQATQFRLFALDKTKINIGRTYWLTNVTNVMQRSFFATVANEGCPIFSPATYHNGVRPFACLF
jgi:hypothetical protein